MKRALWLLAVAVPALCAPVLMPALAQSACMEPVPPTMPDGKTAPAADVRAAAEAVRTFVTQSDDYQKCLNDEYATTVKAGQAAAKEKKQPFDARSLNADREAKIAANQKKKEELGTAYGATAAAYRQAHPPAPK